MVFRYPKLHNLLEDPGMRRNAVAWAALVMSAGALIGSRNYTRALPAAQDVPAEGQRTAKALSDAFGAVADFVKPSVVQISVKQKGGLGNMTRGPRGQGPGNNVTPKELEDLLKKFFGQEGPNLEKQSFRQLAEGTGSGFVYDDKGHILTNSHVVNNADKIMVTFHDGTEQAAKVVGVDRETDVAVIKVDNTTFRPVLKGNSRELRVGQWVLAVGSPFGLSQTVTAGIISATQRDVKVNEFGNFIQTDASINPGNSGGPLVDMSGRVIGINTAIATGPMSGSNAGVGFTIPIDMAARRADKLIRDGKINSGGIGVMMDPLTPSLARQLGLDAKTKGVMVTEVVKGSPAEAAGLKSGDVITTYDGDSIESREDLRYLVTSSDIGKKYPLTYYRDGKKLTAEVSPKARETLLGATPGGPDSRATEPTKPKATEGQKVSHFGLAVTPATPELAEKYGYSKGIEGLIVTRVEDESPAATAGLEEGDLIQSYIKEKKLEPATDLKAFQDYAGKNDEIAVRVRDAKGNPGEVRTLSKTSK